MTGYERVRAAFEKHDLLAPSWSGTQMCTCPVHEDRKASVSLAEDSDSGNALVYCFAGCETKDILEAIGLEMRHLFSDEAEEEALPERKVIAEYIYTDEGGEPLIMVSRTEPKGFFQQRWEDGVWKTGLLDTRRVLYNLPDVLHAVTEGTTVYIVEGEKDVEALRSMGCVATTVIGGSGRGRWKDEYTEIFRGANVTIIPDVDGPGREHGTRIEAALKGVSRSVTTKLPAVGKDVSDHIGAGLGLDELRHGADALSLELGSVDWETHEVEEAEWLFKPYIPARGRCLLYGKTGSLKSLWAMWVAAKLAAEGKRVAYFSLEMRPSQSVSRLRKLNPPKGNFTLFTKLRLGDDNHLRLLSGQNYDLIVVDSWNAAIQEARYDQDVADLDNEVFQPLIEATGATVMLIDNTGHDMMTDKGPVKMNRARGSSAKADKMDVTIWMDRPYSDDNYMADIRVMKMRYDFPMPKTTRISTPRDYIDFWVVSDKTNQRISPMWGGTWVDVAGPSGDVARIPDEALPQDVPAAILGEGAGDQGLGDPAVATDADESNPPSPMTIFELLALARLKDTLGAKPVEEESA